MSEKETKTISFKDIWNVVRKNFIFVLIIIVASTMIGTVYAFFVKKTTYSVSTTAVVKVEGLQTGGSGNELNYFSYSVYLAPLCEGVFKSQNNALRYKEETGKKISVSAINIEWQEQRFDIKISYALQSRDNLKERVVAELNDYITWCIDYVNNSDESIWTSLKDRIKFDKARQDAVTSSTGKVNTVATSLLIGIALAIVYLVIRFYVDDTINNKDVVEDIVGAPVIASISISANFTREGGQDNAI